MHAGLKSVLSSARVCKAIHAPIELKHNINNNCRLSLTALLPTHTDNIPTHPYERKIIYKCLSYLFLNLIIQYLAAVCKCRMCSFRGKVRWNVRQRSSGTPMKQRGAWVGTSRSRRNRVALNCDNPSLSSSSQLMIMKD